MNEPPIIKHIRDILILPFTVTVVIPYLVYDKRQALFNASIFLKVMGSILVICGLILFLWTVYLFKTIAKALAPGKLFRDIHFLAAEHLVDGLKQMGLMKGDAKEAVQQGGSCIILSLRTRAHDGS